MDREYEMNIGEETLQFSPGGLWLLGSWINAEAPDATKEAEYTCLQAWKASHFWQEPLLDRHTPLRSRMLKLDTVVCQP